MNNENIAPEKMQVFLERCYAQSNRLSRLLRDISVLTRMDEAANMIDMEKVLLEDAAVCPLYQPASVYLLNTDYNFRLLSGGLIQNQYTTRK